MNHCGYFWLEMACALFASTYYWEFRNICKLNGEYKYNKILSYFDLSLETLDSERVANKVWKVNKNRGYYKKGILNKQH